MLNYQRVTRFYWHGWYRSQHSSQAQVAVSTVALSAAVTACEGMGQWELALHLFFQNSVGLSCSGMEIRFPGTKGRYPPLGLTVDHGIPWHTMAQGGKVDAILANSAIAAAEKGGRWDLVSGLS